MFKALIAALVATLWVSAVHAQELPPAEYHAQLREGAVSSQTRIAGTGRALLIGDSIAEGFWWNTICSGRIINSGVGGAGAQIIRDHAASFIQRSSPQVVIIAVGVNDAKTDVLPDINDWKLWFNGIVLSAHQAGATMVIETIMPVEANKPLGDGFFSTPTIQAYNAHIRQVATNYGAVLNDNYVAFANAQGLMPAGRTFDGVHPSNALYGDIYNRRVTALTAAWAKRGKNCAGA